MRERREERESEEDGEMERRRERGVKERKREFSLVTVTGIFVLIKHQTQTLGISKDTNCHFDLKYKIGHRHFHAAINLNASDVVIGICFRS